MTSFPLLIEGLWHWFVTLFGVDIKGAGRSPAYTIPETLSTRMSMLFITLPQLKIDTTNTQTTVQLDLDSGHRFSNISLTVLE
jgi:hypothetical protein